MLKCAGKFASVIVVMASLAAGCATAVPTDTTFGPQSATALLVMAAPPADSAEYTYFRRVDLVTGKFEGEAIEIVNAGLGGHQINHDTKSGVWLSVQEVPPGDYTITSWGIVVGNYTQVDCWNAASPVFNLPAGTITIVSSDRTQLLPSYWKGIYGTFLTEFAAVRQKYPNITGTAWVADHHAAITWEKKPGCKDAESFSQRD